jgi:hypothetical protein
VKQAIDVAPFGELADPRVLADPAAAAVFGEIVDPRVDGLGRT